MRADMVFFETPAGGAVFSVGSISWFGALARNDLTKSSDNWIPSAGRRFINRRLRSAEVVFGISTVFYHNKRKPCSR